MKLITLHSLIIFTLFTGVVGANDVQQISINKISADGVNEKIGTIRIEETAFGTLFTPNLEGLDKAGLHGFHVHKNPDCGPAIKNGETVAGMAAGEHLDPDNSDQHTGPFQKHGHLGDLPALYVNDQGKATHAVLAPKIKMKDLRDHALMIHNGGDNYSDQPELGGGGARVACGVFSK
jgi:Cu-Zn family superoxide dismutase